LLTDEGPKADEPKHSYETLKDASRNGDLKIIREFIAQRYESKEEKRRLCDELIQIAKKAKQFEVLHILEPYYRELRTEHPSTTGPGSAGIWLPEHYKKILLGFLKCLSGIIADSPVVLDPDDPNTYRDLFADLTSNVAKHSQQLQQVTNEQDVTRLIEQDSANTKQQSAEINKRIEELSDSNDSLQARIEDIDERLFNIQDLTAKQRKEFIQERESHKKQLAAYECSMLLLQRQQEAVLIRQNTMNFIKGNTNLAMFYRTVENRLNALFISILAAQGGYVKREATAANMTSTTIPFSKYDYPDIGSPIFVSKVI
jgi:DNA gyrase/topoisomerase IV subunit A